jgi:hypothetical protein
MRLNGHGTLTFEDARTWIEETGLCLFLPKRQFSASVAPSFLEAVAGQHSPTPDPKHIELAEELLVRLELDGVAVRLNLLGQPGEHPDFIVAAWVLPYVYALRGDRDWRRSPQLTGSRQVSQLAVQAYKILETGDTTIPSLKHTLGREVTETAVLRAITELWQQLRIIPVIQAPGETAKWQLLRTRFQKAIAEGASTSQVTAISVLASIYLQAVIAASMEEVEMFLAPLTARSKVREVLRGLVATRQVHTISLGHAPHFYVAGTLPEFAVPSTIYSSSSMPASAYFLHSHEEDRYDRMPPAPVVNLSPILPVPLQSMLPPASVAPVHASPIPAAAAPVAKAPEAHTPRIPAPRKPAPAAKSATARPRFTRPAAHTRDRKQSAGSSTGRSARSARPDARSSSTRPSGTRTSSARPSSARPASGARPTNGARPANGARSTAAPRWAANRTKSANGAHSTTNGARSNGNGNGHGKIDSTSRNGKSNSVTPRNGHTANGHSSNGHSKNGKPAAKPTNGARSGGFVRGGTSARKDSRTDARSSHNGRKPALTAGTKAGNSKRFGFTAPRKPGTKKRG